MAFYGRSTRTTEPMDVDYELLVAWRNGDERSGAQLIVRHVPLLRRYFDRRAPHETEDLIQQTLLGCLRAHKDGRPMPSFRAYLLRIARSRWIDYQRTCGRGPHLQGSASQLVDLASSPSRRVARMEVEQIVEECVRELPEALQAVVELHYWDHLKLEELAAALEIPTGTAKSRLRLAKERLYRALRARGKDPNALVNR